VTVGGGVRDYRAENIKEKDELVFRVSAENAVGVSLPALSQTVRLEKHASKCLFSLIQVKVNKGLFKVWLHTLIKVRI
jgi:hypothetical protein